MSDPAGTAAARSTPREMPRLTKAEAIERRERVAEMYRARLPVAQIADALGIDVGSAHSLIHQMRKAGCNLPCRQPKSQRARRDPVGSGCLLADASHRRAGISGLGAARCAG